jgi:hypothetical protein
VEKNRSIIFSLLALYAIILTKRMSVLHTKLILIFHINWLSIHLDTWNVCYDLWLRYQKHSKLWWFVTIIYIYIFKCRDIGTSSNQFRLSDMYYCSKKSSRFAIIICIHWLSSVYVLYPRMYIWLYYYRRRVHTP